MEKNSYSVLEAAKLKGRTPQFIREQIKAGKIPGCTATKIGPKNWTYDIPKLAFDNHLRGANALDIESIKEAVKIAFKEIIEELAEKEIERKLAQ
ncbi:hypothetical protein KSU03_12285 [Fusobacterium polymorphum]|uniref:Helix-turn-helix domain-containing protein n=1 Tax=Fusobacterium nucleatum subsp. polymorphum TaxID=76857 RepID=A0A2C6BJN5_FUSNP|nr:hypothetical protein [Fusobacterium polymorphum]PHI04344.1 hypothetical protein CBG52_11320 [Fusobacterium polymorphum]